MRRNELCDRLSQCQNVCVGTIPEEAIKFSAYIAQNFYQEVFNEVDLAIAVAKIMDNENSEVDKDAAQYLPLIVDALFDVDFAETFREICRHVFGYDPERVIDENEYPKYAAEAVIWWANEVLNPTLESMPSAFAKTRRQFSEYEVKLFKQTLAQEIVNEVTKDGSCFIFCDWSPNEILERAGRKLGIDPLVGYPPRRKMMIFPDQIRFLKDGEEEYTIKDM